MDTKRWEIAIEATVREALLGVARTANAEGLVLNVSFEFDVTVAREIESTDAKFLRACGIVPEIIDLPTSNALTSK